MVEYDFKKAENILSSDLEYYNNLNLEGFFKMMKDPSYCYKFYWLEAIVKLISENRKEATYDEIINEMIVNAWYSVVEYHIHLSGIMGDLGVKDSLEKAVIRLKELSDLSSNASEIEIKNVIIKYDKEIHSEKMTLTQNVPYKALSGFVDTAKISLNRSAGAMMKYFNELDSSFMPLPYTFGDEKGLKRKIYFNKDWMSMIQDNTESILGWVQYEKVRWLQNNNPEVPGIVYKITSGDEKMRKLRNVRNLWDGILDISSIRDVFSDEAIIKGDYDIDHFIPWSFVMNDEIWNLMPIHSDLNSSKSNKLPPWKKYFARYAENQYILYNLVNEKPGINKLFVSCYRDNLHSIWASRELYRKGNSKEEFYNILNKNMRPIYDSAYRQGYEMWKGLNHEP